MDGPTKQGVESRSTRLKMSNYVLSWKKNDRSGICNLIDKEEYNDITKNMSDTFAHLPWHQSLPVQAWDSFD